MGKQQQDSHQEPPFSSSIGLAAIGGVFLVALVGIASILGPGLTGAATIDVATQDGMFQLLKQGAQWINQNNDQVPQTFKATFGNERIVAEIKMASGEVLIASAASKDGKVTSFTKGAIANPTMKGYTDEATVRKIMVSPNPGLLITGAIKDGSIRYESVNVPGSVTTESVSLWSRIASWFGWGA